MSVGIVIATFGDLSWVQTAKRAVASAENQIVPADIVVQSHGPTLHEARNNAAAEVDVDWLIFLDADDELEPGYVEGMLAVEGDIRRPSTRGIYYDGTMEDPPSMIPRTDLSRSNCAVIGSMCSHDYFDQVGGFNDYPCLEDWDLWRRMQRAGATLVEAPEAVYRVHVHDGSRNAPTEQMNATYRQIMESSR